jgi:hypothetical protein
MDKSLAIVPHTVQEAEQLAGTLSRSSLLPPDLRGKPGDVLAILLTGAELGLGPMASLRGVYVVKGRPCISAQMMVGLVQASPACEFFRLVESTPERATYEAKRKGHPEPTKLTWTLEQAKAAKLTGNGTWQAYPAEMLRARCASALARAVFPGEILGLYAKEELEADPAVREPVEVQAERVDEPRAPAAPTILPPSEPEAEINQEVAFDQARLQLTGADSVDALRVAAKAMTELKGKLGAEAFEQLRLIYRERMTALGAKAMGAAAPAAAGA